MPATYTDRLNGLTTSVAVKAPCKAAATTALTLSGEQTVDGIACVTGDRVLYALDGGSVSNGIWEVSTGAWTRAKDFDGNRDVVTGTLVLVHNDGSANLELWIVRTTGDIVIGTTSIDIDPANADESTVLVDLANTVNAEKGAGMVGFDLGTDYTDVPGSPGNVGAAVQEMLGTTEFNLYVATTGSDANDGSIGAPFATLQKALDTLMALGTIGGARQINVAAGTYSSASARTSRIGPANMSRSTAGGEAYNSDGVQSANWIYIVGPAVGYDPTTAPYEVPAVVFDGGGMAGYGVQIEGPIQVLLRDIKFTGYNGSASSYAVSCDGGRLRCENVHTNDCNGLSGSRGAVLEVQGGILYGDVGTSYVGIRALGNTSFSIGPESGPGGEGPLIQFMNQGLLAQEQSRGHCDYTEFEDCTDAIRLIAASRVNCTGASFKRNTRAIRASESSCVFGTDSSAFNDGTADANTEKVVLLTGATDINRDGRAQSGRMSDTLGTTATTITGTTASQDVLTKTLVRGFWAPNVNSLRPVQVIKCVAFGTTSGTADAKQFKLRLGATTIASITNDATDTGSWRVEAIIVFTDSNAQRANLTWFGHLESVRSNTGTATEDNNAAGLDLKFQVQLASAADTCVVQHAHFEVWG